MRLYRKDKGICTGREPHDHVIVDGPIKQLSGFFSSRRRHTISDRDWSSDVCSSDLDSSSSKLKTLPIVSSLLLMRCHLSAVAFGDRKSVVEGKNVDRGGRGVCK